MNPIRRFNELKFKNEEVKEISFYEWELKRYLKKLGYRDYYILNYNFIPSFMPEKLMKLGEKMENVFEGIPLLRCVSGSLFVLAKR